VGERLRERIRERILGRRDVTRPCRQEGDQLAVAAARHGFGGGCRRGCIRPGCIGYCTCMMVTRGRHQS
jgi:hypothetical protein